MSVYLYHYTSWEGYRDIEESGYVRPSTGRGARYGEEVYLTIKTPLEHSVTDIAVNNFDGAWKGRVHKVQIALGFSIRAGEVENSALSVPATSGCTRVASCGWLTIFLVYL